MLTYKKIAFAGLLFLANTKLAQAQEINNYEDFKLYCSDAAYQYNVASPNCDRNKPYYQNKIQEELNRQQNINSEENKVERRKTKKNNVSGYAGLSLGAFFPDDEDAATGFGDSLFVGGRWNRYLATDIEVIYFSGGDDSFYFIDPDYFAWALTINPRLIIPFNNSYNSASIFVSPGLGVSIVDDGYDTETDLAWQIKAGFTIPIKEKFNIILQGRYISQFEEDSNSAISAEIGFSVNFE